MRKSLSLLFYTIISISSFVWFACSKGIEPINGTVTASVEGRVLDELGKPVSNATVKADGSSTSTDVNGKFRINDVQFDKYAAYVSVEKTGYFKGGRTFFTEAGKLKYVEVQLIPKANRGTLAASVGGNINIQSGSAVNFSANSFVAASTNSSYSGNVTIYASWLDPTSSRLAAMMPGNLTGVNTNNQQQLLKTFGMVAVELEGSGGEKLQLAQGKTATITMPIPASMLAAAPATIPLWFFDESTGLWKEEGIATKQGSNYVGTVSHFSFWNCDVPSSYVNLTMTLQNQAGLPLQHYLVKLTVATDSNSASGYTDNEGVVSGGVPPNVNLVMKVYDKCNNLIHSQTIGPFSSTTNLGVITVNANSLVPVIFSGTVANCSATPVTNGIVQVQLDGSYYATAINNGVFSITVERCSSTSASAQLTAVDFQTGQQTANPTTIAVTSGTYAGIALTACGTSTSQFINYVINGNTISFLPPADSLRGSRSGSSTTVYAYRLQGQTNYQSTYFGFDGVAAPGTYNLTYFSLYSTSYNVIQQGIITANITEYGNVGQYIGGSLSGQVKDSMGSNVYPMTGTFRVKRVQ